MATIITLDGKTPEIDDTAWLAPTAAIIGNAGVGPGSGVFYGAVLRADTESIRMGEHSNLQDNAVLHADPGFPTRIGNFVSIGHGAVLHGCTVGDGALVGMNATVLNGAVIGEGSLIAANALVLEGTVVPPRSLVAGVPAKVRRELTDAEVLHCRSNAETYVEITRAHAAATAQALAL
ncbi:gamma carbonic anhydrase family protein [Paeniglutamicibacter sp. ABSL32-1]|uniref:gamma carbonic anhydrase family protein n=1 Tax=Paeniglutamicibacter quisquiliarum TaxID=2849498 RepID=UPI001C2DB19C|nr:gamma carbonic anhydrase family protein [Paeniglutamicibacter quisquiliarum]MBV1777526.1 gamma carbonic anhydrase family protein [Paeniglutamicibacter quisquiliarum]